ncbi:MAG: hypothetical protein BHW59_07550 [Desulfovibrio piger]|nr:MAG: hypothetical protein BHW59_07550 [Desulfovibrio piger]
MFGCCLKQGVRLLRQKRHDALRLWQRDDIFPDLHGLDLRGRLRAAFLTDRGLRLPVFCWWTDDRHAPAGDGRP